MGRSIKIDRQLEKVFEPHRKMFKELKGKNKQFPSQCFFKERGKNRRKIQKLLFLSGRAVNCLLTFSVRCGHRILTPAKSEERLCLHEREKTVAEFSNFVTTILAHHVGSTGTYGERGTNFRSNSRTL
jgi:hypothetical protein